MSPLTGTSTSSRSTSADGGTGGGELFVDLDFSAAPIGAPLAAPAPTNGPMPDVIPYLRTDGKSAVVYKSQLNQVIEIRRDPTGGGGWTVLNLSDAVGARVSVGKGSPFPFVRLDHWNVVVYVGSDSHIHHLVSAGGASGWSDGDLSNQTGDLVVPASDPWPVSRSDQQNCILFVGTDRLMYQLAFTPNGAWWSSTLPAVSPLATLDGRPSAYVHADGVNAIAYRTDSNEVHELRVEDNAWVDAVLPVPSGVTPQGTVFGHKGSQPRDSIPFRGVSANGTQHGYDLSKMSTSPWTADIIK